MDNYFIYQLSVLGFFIAFLIKKTPLTFFVFLMCFLGSFVEHSPLQDNEKLSYFIVLNFFIVLIASFLYRIDKTTVSLIAVWCGTGVTFIQFLQMQSAIETLIPVTILGHITGVISWFVVFCLIFMNDVKRNPLDVWGNVVNILRSDLHIFRSNHSGGRHS